MIIKQASHFFLLHTVPIHGFFVPFRFSCTERLVECRIYSPLFQVLLLDFETRGLSCVSLDLHIVGSPNLLARIRQLMQQSSVLVERGDHLFMLLFRESRVDDWFKKVLRVSIHRCRIRAFGKLKTFVVSPALTILFLA